MFTYIQFELFHISADNTKICLILNSEPTVTLKLNDTYYQSLLIVLLDLRSALLCHVLRHVFTYFVTMPGSPRLRRCPARGRVLTWKTTRSYKKVRLYTAILN